MLVVKLLVGLGFAVVLSYSILGNRRGKKAHPISGH